VRLERRGDTISGSFSPDGANWTEVGSTTVAMPATVYVVLASLAPNKAQPLMERIIPLTAADLAG
jgi:hypothetical protein